MFDRESRELSRAGRPVPLTPKAFRLLGLLLERRPRACPKSELNEALWPDTFVVETNLANLVAELRAALGEKGRRDGSVRTLMGRVRYLPDIAARNFAVRAGSERIAGNTPIQGGSADIIKVAMIHIARELPESHAEARLILQVHDELIFEVPKAGVEPFAGWVRERMEGAIKLKVPVVVDVKSGPNWA